MRHPNWSGYASESAAEFAAEDRIGAYTVEDPTPEEGAALSLELARENAEGVEEDDPRCEWCDSPPVDGEYAYAPFCSPEYQRRTVGCFTPTARASAVAVG